MAKKKPEQDPKNTAENTNEQVAASDQRSLEERIEDFVLEYKTQLSVVVVAIAVLIFGYIGYNQFIQAPMELEAEEEMYRAQWTFNTGEYEEALNGVTGEYMGFLDIASEYRRTKSGNLANYYAAICLLHTGQYEQAIDHFNQFSTKSKTLGPLKFGGIGDAHSQLGDYEKAAENYMRAARLEDNKLTSPMYFRKAGLAYEELGNLSSARDAFREIVDNYSDHQDAFEAEKYLSRVETKINSGGS